MPFVYILECSDSSFYVGSTRNLDQRMQDHDLGVVNSYTADRRPLRLVWFCECERIDEAYVLERKIKGWRREKRIALIEGRFSDLAGLSRGYSREDGT